MIIIVIMVRRCCELWDVEIQATYPRCSFRHTSRLDAGWRFAISINFQMCDWQDQVFIQLCARVCTYFRVFCYCTWINEKRMSEIGDWMIGDSSIPESVSSFRSWRWTTISSVSVMSFLPFILSRILVYQKRRAKKNSWRPGFFPEDNVSPFFDFQMSTKN